MKSIVMPATEQLIEKTEDQIVKQVKETVAIDATVIDNKVKFTAVDMWNRNRNSRSASDRMRRWNMN